MSELHAAGLKAAIAIALDEALAALGESIDGLSDEQLWAFPLPARHNIVTLAEHCIQGLDLYACEVQGAPLTFEPEARFDALHHSPEALRPEMHDLPTVAQEADRIERLREAVRATLEGIAPGALVAPGRAWWFEENPGKTRADAYWRCIWHTAAHVRQIWLLRGLLGAGDDRGWPEQHWR